MFLLFFYLNLRRHEFLFVQITIKEEDRLASIIADIDEDVKVVPRGSFIKTPTGLVVPNRSFEGEGIESVYRATFSCINHPQKKKMSYPKQRFHAESW